MGHFDFGSWDDFDKTEFALVIKIQDAIVKFNNYASLFVGKIIHEIFAGMASSITLFPVID